VCTAGARNFRRFLIPYLVAIESFRAYSDYVIGVFPQPNGNGKPRVQRRRRRRNNN
jgi:hypothetical protein